MSRPITYRFAGFLLEPARAALMAPDGRAIQLRPKTYEVLRHLLDNAGRVVPREELLETVWPGVFVTDDSVTQCVAEIRRALGPKAANLRTLKRRGYVLDVEVVRETTAAASSPAPLEPEPTAAEPPMPVSPARLLPRRRFGPRSAALLGGGFLLLLLSLVAWRAGTPPAGVTEQITLPAQPDPSAPAPSPHTTGAEPTGPLGRRDRAEALRAEGLAILRDIHACRPRWLEARVSFERAIAEDPSLAAAHADAAFTHLNPVWAETSLDAARDLQLAEGLARRALELEPELASGYAALGTALHLGRRHEEALSALRRAVSLDPQAAPARANMGLALLALGRAAEAGDAIRASISTAGTGLLPMGHWLNSLGTVELHLGRGDYGAESFRRSLAWNAPAAREVRQLHFAAALALGGRVADARAVAADALLREPELGLAFFRTRAISGDPAYLAGRETLLRGLILAGVPEGSPGVRPSRRDGCCVPGPPGEVPRVCNVPDDLPPPPLPRQEAQRLFRLGIAAFRRPDCPANWLEARDFYARAREADSTFAPAYTEGAFTYANILRNGLSANPAEDLRMAQWLAERGAALAPDYSAAHGALGAVFASAQRHEEALAAYRRALLLNGLEHSARANVGQMLMLLGRAEEAEAPLRASIALDPRNGFRSSWQVNLGLVELYLGRPGHGAEAFRGTLALRGLVAPEIRRLYLAAALALEGRDEDARAVVADVLSREPRYSIATFRRASAIGAPASSAYRERLYRGLALAGLPDDSEGGDPIDNMACGTMRPPQPP
jgi:DNA-binding winged helix-turn-helix (wHTH) protein/tetratricopeptide (TPR) repeat protein